jgi:ribosomal protein L40E
VVEAIKPGLMTVQFKIFLIIMAVSMYLIGIIAWKVQNDALKRGYSSVAASFWSLGVLFMSIIMLPLYIVLREKSSPENLIIDPLEEARKKLYITCPSCGESNPPELSKCLKCEKDLLGSEKLVGTKACPYCGEQNQLDAAFCRNCDQGI